VAVFCWNALLLEVVAGGMVIDCPQELQNAASSGSLLPQ
jgi:hypothetical protein